MRDFFIEHKYFLVSILIILLMFILRNAFVDREDIQETILPSITISQVPENSFYIEVVGSVNAPGVFKVTDNILVIDAIAMAGGYTDNADLDYVAQNIPFSKRVIPEMKIYIPYLKSNVNIEMFKLNINKASKEQLIAINGVGEVTALKIMEMRPFTSWEQLQIVTGIRRDIIDSLKEAATL